MEQKILPENPTELINAFFNTFDYFTNEEIEQIKKAWSFLIDKSNCLDKEEKINFYTHSYRVAYICAEYALDCQTVVAAFLHDVFSLKNVTAEEINNLFGQYIFNIIKHLEKIENIHSTLKTVNQADAVRNMFFAIADDIRVIFIKLAERVDFMRYLKSEDEQTQKIVAQETLNIWAPLADRLGIKQGKNELEDLSLKFLNPDAFKQIKLIVAQKQNERSEYLEKAKQSLYKSAVKANLEIVITSRAKHFYSIYQKMRKRNKEASELYDLLAMRVLCQSNADCYALLGIVHNLWKPLEGRFKDYIAMPKSNGYQSLHTTVMADGKPLEIQIRTHQMDSVAEHGVASHWLYKKGLTKDKVDVKSLPIFNQMQKLCSEHLDDESLYNEFKDNLLKDKIVVFTPKGDVIQLPVGATAIDFAYQVHSKIGETITAAKADGKIIPLSAQLENTQIIEIITSPKAHPTENQLANVVTYKAKQKIKAWLAANNFAANNLSSKNLQEEKNIQKNEGIQQSAEQQVQFAHKPGKKKTERPVVQHSGKVRIENTTNFVITFSKCCNPKYPDKIVGYVSHSRGITIHKEDCHIYNRIREKDKRSVKVEWDNL